MTTNVAPLILTLCAVANVSIGVYVLCTNPRSSTHRAFFLYAMPIGVWAFAVALTHGAASPAHRDANVRRALPWWQDRHVNHQQLALRSGRRRLLHPFVVTVAG